MNRRTFSTLLATGALGACARRSSPPPPLRLRVLSFNLRYINSGDTEWRAWTARRDAAAALIEKDNADLIGLQEALRPMLDDVVARVPGYVEIGVGREDGQTQGEYSAILARKDRFEVQESGTFWLSDTPEVPNSMTWKNRVTRVCTWARLLDRPTGRTLHFYNTHLDHESQEAREKGSAQIVTHLSERVLAADGTISPFALTGDFNAGEDNVVVTNLKEGPLKLVDSWRAAHPTMPAAESGTMHGFSGAIDRAKIDYVFVPPSATVLDADILRDGAPEAWPSDHFPVRATVEFA